MCVKVWPQFFGYDCLTPKHVETKAVDCSTVRAVDPTRRIEFKQEIISK